MSLPWALVNPSCLWVHPPLSGGGIGQKTDLFPVSELDGSPGCWWETLYSLLAFQTPHPVLLSMATLPLLLLGSNALSSPKALLPGALAGMVHFTGFLWHDKVSVPASGVSGLSEQQGQSPSDWDFLASLK